MMDLTIGIIWFAAFVYLFVVIVKSVKKAKEMKVQKELELANLQLEIIEHVKKQNDCDQVKRGL